MNYVILNSNSPMYTPLLKGVKTTLTVKRKRIFLTALHSF